MQNPAKWYRKTGEKHDFGHENHRQGPSEFQFSSGSKRAPIRHKTRNMFEIWAKSLKCDAERCNDLYGLQDLALKTELIGGEAFVLKKFFANREPFGMCLKVLEGDRVQNPFGYPDCDDCCGGIEVDENHTPVAYHITKKIPFSIDNYGNNVDTVRIPAFDSMDNPNVLHVFETDRTDQRRGISMLAPLIVDAKQLDRFKDARLMKALVTSLLSFPRVQKEPL